MADYDDGCRVKSISTKCPTKKHRPHCQSHAEKMPRFQDAIPGDTQRAWQRRANPVLIDPLHLAPESTVVRGNTLESGYMLFVPHTTALAQAEPVTVHAAAGPTRTTGESSLLRIFSISLEPSFSHWPTLANGRHIGFSGIHWDFSALFPQRTSATCNSITSWDRIDHLRRTTPASVHQVAYRHQLEAYDRAVQQRRHVGIFIANDFVECQ